MGNACLHSTGVAFNAVSPGHNDGGGATNDPRKYRGANSAPQSNISWFGAKTRRRGVVGPTPVFQQGAESGAASPHAPANAVAAAGTAGVAVAPAGAVEGAVGGAVVTAGVINAHTPLASLPNVHREEGKGSGPTPRDGPASSLASGLPSAPPSVHPSATPSPRQREHVTDATGLQYRDVVTDPTNMVTAAKRGDLTKVRELVAKAALARGRSQEDAALSSEEAGDGTPLIINALGMWSTTPLMTAVQYGHTDVADFLLNQEGIDVAHVNENGATALLFACAEGNAVIARRILYLGATPAPAPMPAFYNSVVDKSAPATPLIVACTNGHTECVEALADAGVCVSSVSENDLPFKSGQPRKMAPLHIAALHRRMTTFKALMSCGARWQSPAGLSSTGMG